MIAFLKVYGSISFPRHESPGRYSSGQQELFLTDVLAATHFILAVEVEVAVYSSSEVTHKLQKALGNPYLHVGPT